jgi:hypothetical protein
MQSQESQQKPAYDPFIHGTSSLMLPMLKRTDFKMVSTIEMLEDYALAPMGGEVDNVLWGGMDSIDPPRYICFGHMHARSQHESTPQSSVYDLKRVAGVYASSELKTNIPTVKETQERTNYYVDQVGSSFERINILLVHYARAKQLGVEQPIPEDKYGQLVSGMKGMVQFYSLLQLLGKHVWPDVEKYKATVTQLKSSVADTPAMREGFVKEKAARIERLKLNEFEDDDVDDMMEFYTFDLFLESKRGDEDVLSAAMQHHFSFNNLSTKVKQSGVDVKTILNNPTPENLAQALQLLELPTRSTIKVGLFGQEEKKEVDLSEVQMFSLAEGYAEGTENHCETNLHHYAANSRGYLLQSLLLGLFKGRTNDKTLQEFGQVLSERTEALERKIAALENIHDTPVDRMQFSDAEKSFMEQSFPMVLVSHANDKIEMFNPATHEYRADEPLKFGEDITMIATDTTEHQMLLVRYLNENNMKGVEVVLTEQLFASKQAFEEKAETVTPKSQYTSTAGLLKLSFLAAKALQAQPGEVKKVAKASENCISATLNEFDSLRQKQFEQSSEEASEQANTMLNAAEQYNSVELNI